MGKFIGSLRIEPAGENLWRTCAPFCYVTDDVERIDIPLLFEFNGTSIPRFAWSLIGHPLSQEYLPAACIHDHLYITGVFTRRKSDHIFKQALRDSGVDWWKRTLMWLAIRIGGKVPWDNYRG